MKLCRYILCTTIILLTTIYSNIPISISLQEEMEGFPIATGIPFKKGELLSAENLTLTNGTQEVPAQFRRVASWEDGSIKSALVSFLSPKEQTELTLNKTPHSTYKTPLSYKETEKEIAIETGLLKTILSKEKFSIFEGLWIDSNRDGLYSSDEKLIDTSGTIYMKDAKTGTIFYSNRAKKTTYTIEEEGPLKLQIRAEGELTSLSGATQTTFITRFTFYTNSPLIQFEYTMVDREPARNIHQERADFALVASEVALQLPHTIRKGTYRFGGDNETVYSAPLSGEKSLIQKGKLNWGDNYSFQYSGVGTGERAAGYMGISSEKRSIGVSLQHFWQQFPTGLALSDTTLTIYLFPQDAIEGTPEIAYPAQSGSYRKPNSFYFPRHGSAKTYRLLFSFSEDPQISLSTINKNFQTNAPTAHTSAEVYTRSGAFGRLSPAGSHSEGVDRWLKENVYGFATKNQWNSLLLQYGWRDYGDRMRPGWEGEENGVKIPSYYNDCHVGAGQFYKQYLRTLDTTWFALAQRATRHVMDIDIAHSSRIGYWNHGEAQWGPGELLAIRHAMIDHNARNLHPGHAHISGLPDYYLLTGDERALEVIKEVGDWWSNAVESFFPTPVEKNKFAEAERDFGWPLFVVNEVYRVTGEKKYFDVSTQMVKHLIQWWQQPAPHLFDGDTIGYNNASKGTGYWTMYPRCDNTVYIDGKPQYNGTNPWMAASLLSAVIGYYENNKQYTATDAYTIEEMLLQTLNYICTYGWVEKDKGFVYVEGQERGSKPGHLNYPIAYIYKIFKERKHQNPEWYPTASLWKEIVLESKERYKNPIQGSQSDIYGYEVPFPLDILTLMEEDFGSATPTGQNKKVNPNLSMHQLPHTILFQTSSLKEKDLHISIFDARGRVISQKKMNLVEGVVHYPIPNLAQGLYFIRATSGEQTIKDKLVISH